MKAKFLKKVRKRYTILWDTDHKAYRLFDHKKNEFNLYRNSERVMEHIVFELIGMQSGMDYRIRVYARMKAIIIFLFLPFLTQAQDIYHGCPLSGDKARTAHLDSLKNRYEIPTSYKQVSWQEIADMKVGNTNNEAVQFTGYVILVKSGGKETCNCHSATDLDIHIEIAKDSSYSDNKDALVVEISPRLQEILGIDLQHAKRLLRHYVSVGGYLFSDIEHKQNSYVDNPNGTNIWRVSCEELHPVTKIEILR